MVFSAKMDVKTIFINNLKALIGNRSINSTAKSWGIPQRTLQNLVSQERGPTLESISVIAKANGLEEWQLLVADLNVANPPLLAKESEKMTALMDKMKKLSYELQEVSIEYKDERKRKDGTD